MKKGLLGKILVAILPALASVLFKIWFATCRVTEHKQVFWRAVQKDRGAIIATFWHFSIVFVFYHLRHLNAAVLVSASADGEYIARFAERLNCSTVRGSRNRRGVSALKELIKKINQGENVGIVADGSQGPPLIVQAGSLLMSSKTGRPILPLTWSASRYLAIKSWDKTAVPLPFSRVELFYGEPLQVPPGADASQLEQYRKKLEDQMRALYQQAWAYQQKQGH